MAMFANNLSTLGVSAAQLDNRLDTQSYSVQWLPTTGEFGLWNTFGDYDDHQKVATRVGVHFTHSLEEKQSQPGTEGIENSQIRLTDGSVIFTPDLNWYFMKERGLRLNGEWMYVNRSPVGYTAYPYPVGASGTVFHINLEMNF
jgi:hypothetical protein